MYENVINLYVWLPKIVKTHFKPNLNITKGLYDRYETKFQTNINQFLVILIKNRESHCGDLNESGLHRLIYLNGWSPVGRMCEKELFLVPLSVVIKSRFLLAWQVSWEY